MTYQTHLTRWRLMVLSILSIFFGSLGLHGQIGCGTSISSQLIPNSICGVLPECQCDCQGNIQTLSVVYIGSSGAELNVWSKPNHQTLIANFPNLLFGDTLNLSASGLLPGDDFETNTMFELVGIGEIGINTNCNVDIAGGVFGDFLVIGFSDIMGNMCNAQACRQPCDCNGKLEEISVKYTGPTGVDINVWDKETQNNLVASFSNVVEGQILVASAQGLSANDFEVDTWFEIVGQEMISIPTDCSENIQSEFFGDFQVVAFVDGQGNSCSSFGGGEIDLTVAGSGPFTYSWSDGSTSEDLTSAVDGYYSVTITDANNCSVSQSYTVGFSATPFITEGFVTDSTACYIEVPKICSCPCTGQLEELTLYYSGVDGQDVFVWNNASHDVLIASFSNVQSGDQLVVSAIGALLGDQFESVTYVELSSGVEEAIPTSCDSPIAGENYGDFQVYGHKDTEGGICNASNCIPPCGCNGKVQNFTMQYLGTTSADINIWGDAAQTLLAESFTNVGYGDIMFVEAVGVMPNDGFGPTTYLEVVGDSTYSLHTSCSIDAIGVLLGDLRIIHFTDGQDETCNELACNGSIDIGVLTGTGPFSYQWSNGATTEDLENLCPGNYSVEIFDAYGCTHVEAFELTCYCDGNDSPACAEIISSENLACILGGNFEEPTLQCTPILGSLNGSTPSPEAYSNAATGEDRWYMFTATFPGVSIYVESEDFDIMIELQDRFGNFIDLENKVEGLGSEILNIGDLIEGESYLLGIRAVDGFEGDGNFAVCITDLPDSRCDRFGPFDLCDIFKADWVCADDYLFHFTNETTGELITHQSGYAYTFIQWIDIPIHNWGEDFTIEVYPIYHIEDGNGTLEYITVDNNEPCSVQTMPMPTAELDLSDRCEEIGPQFLGAYIAASPWICSATDWTWEFMRVDQAELPIQHSRGAANRFMQISDVNGIVPGATYQVRVKPEFSTGEPTNWGEWQCLQTVGSAQMPLFADEVYQENFKKDFDQASAESEWTSDKSVSSGKVNWLVEPFIQPEVSIYPNPSTSGELTLEFVGVVDQEAVLEVIDVYGNLIESRILSIPNNKHSVNYSIENDLSSGVYMVVLKSIQGMATARWVYAPR